MDGSLPKLTQAGPSGLSQSNDAADRHTDAGEGDRLTYKFQRLRERLRSSITSGEYTGKLPGERQLARRFRVNAKTLSKALTDLAAEGLLERAIGRGTFVKVQSSTVMGGVAVPVTVRTSVDDAIAEALPTASSSSPDRWLVICPLSMAKSPAVCKLLERNPAAHVVHETASLRPSFLSTVKAVIDFDTQTSAAFLRDMVVRNASVVIVDHEPATYSVNAVVFDRMLAASNLARDLMLAGHSRFVAVERRGGTQVSEAIRKTAQRFAPDAWIDVAYPSEATNALVQGATAIICDSVESARLVRDALVREGIDMPGRVSLCAMGLANGEVPCSGYYVDVDKKVDAIVQSLKDAQQHRPTMLWLTGSYHDGDTTGPIDVATDAATKGMMESNPFPTLLPTLTR